jgi:carboxyl-terminal processing protease
MKEWKKAKRYIEEFKTPFDYSEESFNTDYEKAPYAKSTELTDRWRKQIKLSTLSS